MDNSQKSLLKPDPQFREELVPCDGTSFSIPYERRLLELLEETKTIELSPSCDIHPRLGYEKNEWANARKQFKKEDWILAATLLRGERLRAGLLVLKANPQVSYLFDCFSLQVTSCYFEGLDIDEGDGNRIDLAFFIETLKEVHEEPKKPLPPKKKEPVSYAMTLGEDDEDYEAPEILVQGFVPAKKRTFVNKNTKPEPIEVIEEEGEVEIEVEKPAFSANRKGKPRRL